MRSGVRLLCLLLVSSFLQSLQLEKTLFSEQFKGRGTFERKISIDKLSNAYLRMAGYGTVHLELLDERAGERSLISCLANGLAVCKLWDQENKELNVIDVVDLKVSATPSSSYGLHLSVVSRHPQEQNSCHLQTSSHFLAEPVKVQINWNSRDSSYKWQDFNAEYKVGEVLGEGNFGKVHSGINLKTGQSVAIKKLDKKKIKGLKADRLQEREIRVLSQVPIHPNLCKYHKYIDTAEYLYIIFDICGDTDAKQRYLKVPASEQEAAVIIKQLVETLIFLHNVGIYHRDPKPSNMMLELLSLKLRLVDFGIATTENRRTRSVIADGDHPPEFFLNNLGAIPSMTDTWITGISLYWFLTGRKPFGMNGAFDKDKPRYINNLKTLNYEIPSYLSLEVQDLLRRILTYEKDRISLEEILKHQWLAGVQIPL